MLKGIEENIRDKAMASGTHVCVYTLYSLYKIAVLIKTVMTESRSIIHTKKEHWIQIRFVGHSFMYLAGC